jgi:heme/copper-type cytochrome/quinol oxidase subunit 2
VASGAGRDIEIRISRAGFDPREVTIRRGETVRLVMSAEDGEHCFAVDGLRVEKRVTPDRPVAVELTAEQAGRFPFYCCLERGEAARVERGELIVSE